jgi:hypothetical protein
MTRLMLMRRKRMIRSIRMIRRTRIMDHKIIRTMTKIKMIFMRIMII